MQKFLHRLSNLNKMLSMIAICVIFAFTMSSCEDILPPLEETSSSFTEEASGGKSKGGESFQVAGVNYVSVPNLNTAVPNSNANITLTGTCGSHYGGVLSAKVVAQNGDKFTIRISKQQGNFTSSGIAYIKSGSVCGGVAGSKAYFAGTNYVDIPITATFSPGLVHFYAITVDVANQFRYYAEPVLIYTSPMYSSTWTLGTTLGYVNGVNVVCNGTNTNLDTNNYYQCTEFCIRYYSQVYGRNISGMGHATYWHGKGTTKALEQYSNGSIAPRVGDILCMSGGSKGYGHVAIITRVESGYVQIAHQNSGKTWAPIGAQLTRSGDAISSPTNYTIQGLLRAPAY